MKLFLKSLCVAFVLTVIFSMLPFETECKEISNEVFRLHILANSDAEFDQELKLKVRDKVLEYTESLFENSHSKEEAENAVSDNLQEICNVALKEVRNNGYDYGVTAEITNMYFTTRYYDSYTLPSGMYDALRITIGSGEGHNWWCVLYPPLCFVDASSGILPESSKEIIKENISEEDYSYISEDNTVFRFKYLTFLNKLFK